MLFRCIFINKLQILVTSFARTGAGGRAPYLKEQGHGGRQAVGDGRGAGAMGAVSSGPLTVSTSTFF
jgi:hypothetical protein